MQPKMQPLTVQQACDFLESAAHFEKHSDSGRYLVTCGIDAEGRSFILLDDAIDGPRIAYL